jgi:hypothetical protein
MMECRVLVETDTSVGAELLNASQKHGLLQCLPMTTLLVQRMQTSIIGTWFSKSQGDHWKSSSLTAEHRRRVQTRNLLSQIIPINPLEEPSMSSESSFSAAHPRVISIKAERSAPKYPLTERNPAGQAIHKSCPTNSGRYSNTADRCLEMIRRLAPRL